MGFTLTVENYRGLRKIRWSASGVCAVTGPNGSGKSTLLEVLTFLQTALNHDFERAVAKTGGTFGLKNWRATADEQTRIGFQADELRWEMTPVQGTAGFQLPVPETVFDGDNIVVRRSGTYWEFGGTRSELKGDVSILGLFESLNTQPHVARAHLAPLLSLRDYRCHADSSLRLLRTNGSSDSTDPYLHADGGNVFSTLRNWGAGARENRERLDFVRAGLRACFPDYFDDFDFEVAGKTVTMRFYVKSLPHPVPAYAAPNGLLVSLINFCAIASAPDKGIVAVDEPENGLHPFAIRAFLEETRRRAEQRGLTVLLATHSPAILNEFAREPGKVFVMEPGHDVLPVPLDQHSNPDWLANFALGDLYMNQTFGAQHPPAP